MTKANSWFLSLVSTIRYCAFYSCRELSSKGKNWLSWWPIYCFQGRISRLDWGKRRKFLWREKCLLGLLVIRNRISLDPYTSKLLDPDSDVNLTLQDNFEEKKINENIIRFSLNYKVYFHCYGKAWIRNLDPCPDLQGGKLADPDPHRDQRGPKTQFFFTFFTAIFCSPYPLPHISLWSSGSVPLPHYIFLVICMEKPFSFIPLRGL